MVTQQRVAVLLALLVAAAAAALWWLVDARDDQATGVTSAASAEAEVASSEVKKTVRDVATEAATRVYGYSWESLADDKAAAREMLTDRMLDQYDRTMAGVGTTSRRDHTVVTATVVDSKGESRDFTGKLTSSGYLLLERVDPKSKEAQQLRMSTNNDGARFIYEYWHKASGRTTPTKSYQVDGSKEGESIGAKEKKPECVVSGGVGTSTVSYGGKTYYVCCSGCRDAFNENPAKIIAEYNKKKKR